MNDDGKRFFAILSVVTIVSAILATCAGSCDVSEDRARQVLKGNNLELKQTTGYDWWSCSEGDYFNTGFAATNQKGETVTGVVCCGGPKACTVRF